MASHGGVREGSGHVKDGAIDLVAGTLGGVAVVYTGQPLDTVKVKMQTCPTLYANWPGCMSKTFRLDGIRGLYSGAVPALLANVAENATLFTAYGYCQKVVGLACSKHNTMEMSPVENAISGSLAAFFAAAVLCPTADLFSNLSSAGYRRCVNSIRTFAAQQLIYQAYPCSTSLSISREMLRTKGISAFFVGMTPTLAREVPGYFFFFGAYEYSRHLLTPAGKTKDQIGHARTAISGGVGGVALWAAIFPADVVKSRMQVSGEGRFFPIFSQILRKEGVRALYKGLLPTLIRSCISTAALFTVYENSKRFLHSIL